MTDEIDQLFARLRGTAVFSTTSDPNAIAYETQGAQIAPVGFLDSLDAVSRGALQAGAYNGSFDAPPTNTSSNIDNKTNPLPGGWRFTQASGTKVTASWTTDATYDSGGILKLSLAGSGAAGDDGYMELLMPILASPSFTLGYLPVVSTSVPSSILGTAALAEAYVVVQFVKSDGTTTGTAQTVAFTIDYINAGPGYLPYFMTPNDNGVPPLDAAYLRIRLGIRRAGATNSQSGAVYFNDVYFVPATPRLVLTDIVSPDATNSTQFLKSAGSLYLGKGASGTFANYISLDHTTGFISLNDGTNSASIGLRGQGGIKIGNFLFLPEHSAPPTPPSGFGVLYVSTTGHLRFINDAGTDTAIT